MPDVVIWGRRPPPLGGVTRCVQGLSQALDESVVDHAVVDWRQPQAVRHMLLSRRALHLHNVSSVLRLGFVMVAKSLSGARSIVYFHSGTLLVQLQHSRFRRRLARWGFRHVNAVWVTNASLAEVIREVAGVEAVVVSPFSVTQTNAHRTKQRRDSALVFVGYGKELYGLSTVLELKRFPELSGWSFTVVAYGDHESCAKVRAEAEEAGCRVLVNLDAAGVASVLVDHEVLLRPTTADGDAMIVREALAAGLRVLASDAVPRPSGVELVAATAPALASALINGAPVSDGSGLGDSVSEAVLKDLAGMEDR